MGYEYNQRGLRSKLTYPAGPGVSGNPPKPEEHKKPKKDERPGKDKKPKKGKKDKGPKKIEKPTKDEEPKKHERPKKDEGPKKYERPKKGKKPRKDESPKPDNRPRKDKKPKRPAPHCGAGQSVPEMSISYQYDALGRIQRVISDNNDVLAAYLYDDLSRRTHLTLGNGAAVVYEYDLGNRLTRLTNHVSPTGTIAFDYANYDRVGNRLSCQIDDNPTQEYLYDNLYQLTYVDYNEVKATRYYYDDLGNRTAVNDGQIAYYASNNLNQYTAVDSTDFSYDLNGNLTHTGQYIYYYDCENRLTDVNDQSDLPVASFKYDTAGRRIEKTVYGSPNQITRYLYDGDQVIAEYDGTDTLLRRFIYGPGIDEPICVIDVAGGNEPYYYHFDGLGSVVALSNSNTEIVERYAYDVFGAPTIKDANGIPVAQSTINNPYLFTGRRFDSETGLYYYRARYYAHDIGRFLQTDPIGYADGINWYGYCGNNPIGLVDPWGLCKDSYMPTAGDFFAGWASGIPGTFKGMGYGLVDVGSGLYSTVRHPIQSIHSAGSGIGKAIAHPIQAVKGVGRGIYNASVTLIGDDREASGGIIGRVAGSAAVSAVGAKVVGAGVNRVRSAGRSNAVIGKLDDITGVNRGEHTLLQHMDVDRGSAKANWYQNSRVLRIEMRKGVPIRDASISGAGKLTGNTGFLKAERNLLSNHGWKYNPSTGYWYPPN